MATNIASIEAIFSGALEILSAEARVAYLDRACSADPEIRRQVESLIDAHERAGRFLASPTASFESGSPEPVGSTVGPDKLMEQIGERGMGVFHVADQTQPVRRKVALKVIKPGMDTKQVIARFEAERQALAMMDHPNIAKVLDAGTTPPSEGGGLGGWLALLRHGAGPRHTDHRSGGRGQADIQRLRDRHGDRTGGIALSVRDGCARGLCPDSGATRAVAGHDLRRRHAPENPVRGA
jgi:hypothetical protein